MQTRTVVLSCFLFLVAPTDAGAAPVIRSATVDLLAERILISGIGLDRVVEVRLGSDNLFILTKSAATIEVELPPGLDPGSYRLSVKESGTRRNPSDWVNALDITIGALGPEGPQGDPGPREAGQK
jgi:hypothetical protein